MARRVFISYSGPDEHVARSIKKALLQTGAEAWLAADELRPGQAVAPAIQDALEAANLVVLIIGQNPPSVWARHEWSQALQMAADPHQPKPIVPILVDDAVAPPFLGDQRIIRFDSHSPPQERGSTPSLEDWKTNWNSWSWTTPDDSKTVLADRLREISDLAHELDDSEE
ncbi:MAG: toll/interleukin-1 receptor domain-containing protein [Solirubrobacteraceae bacterium]|nr:toll/interleukin-1 receptor domain-containing protein [Solirubrobacteraceae bacterium]